MSDAALLKLEAAFNANSDREEKAADKVEDLDAEIERLRKRMLKVDRKHDRQTQVASRLLEKIMRTRASSLEGMLAKVRVRKRWNSDDESGEIAVLKSLVADIEAIAGGEGMSIRSKNMDDLESEIGHLAALIGTITDIAIEIPGTDPMMHRVQGLSWIARDITERLAAAPVGN